MNNMIGNDEDNDTFDMMMKLAKDVEYYSDRISHERLWKLRDKLQKIEEIFNREYAKEVHNMMLASEEQ